MVSTSDSMIADLLVRDLPRNLVLAVQEGLIIGAQRAHKVSIGMNKGHFSNVLGQLRHFHMNETFHQALVADGIQTSALSGNKVVVGSSGIFKVARLNTRDGAGSNHRRSKIRREMSEINSAIQSHIFPNLFSDPIDITEGTVFFIAYFSKTPGSQQETPRSIELVLPDRNMKRWLFRMPLEDFVTRYETVQVDQPDLAVPTLKPGINIEKGQDGESV